MRCLRVPLMENRSPRLKLGFQATFLLSFLSPLLPACDNNRALSKRGHLDIGVHFSTAEAKQYKSALDFWTTVLDMTWHVDNTRSCAIEVIDRPTTMFPPMVIANALTPDGVIEVNNRADLSAWESYATAVHEIGHLFGLEHNRRARSVMFYLDVAEDAVLDRHDLKVLAKFHKLRTNAKEVHVRFDGLKDVHSLLSTAGSFSEWSASSHGSR